MHPEHEPARAADAPGAGAPGGPPAVAPCCGPFLRSLGVDLDAVLAGWARHPSAAPSPGPVGAPAAAGGGAERWGRQRCPRCGFAPLGRAEAVEALRRLPADWRAVCKDGPRRGPAAEASRELQDVTARVAACRGRTPPPVDAGRGEGPAVLDAPRTAGLVAAQIADAAGRLARLTEGLSDEEWARTTGPGAAVPVSELVNRPLHSIHFELGGCTAPCTSATRGRAAWAPSER